MIDALNPLQHCFPPVKGETNHYIIRVGNPDDWRNQNCLPQDCLPVGNSEVGNPEGNRLKILLTLGLIISDLRPGLKKL